MTDSVERTLGQLSGKIDLVLAMQRDAKDERDRANVRLALIEGRVQKVEWRMNAALGAATIMGGLATSVVYFFKEKILGWFA